jgi:hypothetical protein
VPLSGTPDPEVTAVQRAEQQGAAPSVRSAEPADDDSADDADYDVDCDAEYVADHPVVKVRPVTLAVATPAPPVVLAPVAPVVRRLPERRGWVLAALVGLLAGVALFLPHRSGWVGHNGDHYYYASTALQYAGAGYDRSLQLAAEYFGYPYQEARLDLGFLDPAVAPLIYPRVVFGLVGLPAIDLLGVPGVWFPGLIFGAVAVGLLMVLAGRRLGRPGVLLVPALIGATGYATEFMFGIYLEAPVILAVAAMMLTFPLGTARRTWWHAVAAAGLVPVMMLSRQVPLLPIGMALGGWLWAWVATRRLRNRWAPFAMAIVPATVISYGLLARWAPYDVLPYLFDKTGTQNTLELIRVLPAMWRQTLGADGSDLLANDLPIVLVAALGVFGAALAIRNPIAGVFLGSLVSGAVTELLNGQPNDFRYLSPSLPPLLLLAALALAWLGRLVLHRALRLIGMRGRAWAGAALVRPEPPDLPDLPDLPDPSNPPQLPDRPGGAAVPGWRTRPAAVAAGVWLVVAALVAGTVAVHRPAPIDGAPRVHLDDATFPAEWPFTVREGTLICAGPDYQLWFVTPDGVRYALSGTAMADSLWTPRALELAPGRITYSWPQIKPMLTAGMGLCRTGRAFQTDPG